MPSLFQKFIKNFQNFDILRQIFVHIYLKYGTSILPVGCVKFKFWTTKENLLLDLISRYQIFRIFSFYWEMFIKLLYFFQHSTTPIYCLNQICVLYCRYTNGVCLLVEEYQHQLLEWLLIDTFTLDFLICSSDPYEFIEQLNFRDFNQLLICKQVKIKFATKKLLVDLMNIFFLSDNCYNCYPF